MKARRYLYAPMEYGDKIIVVKITVKEYADESLQNKLYAIEAVDMDLVSCLPTVGEYNE